jgi:hypothetical protein
MSKYVIIYQNSMKNIEKKLFFRKKFFGQKCNFLAHSGGWIVPKNIF